MQFRGHLLLPDDVGPGLLVNLDVAEHHLAVESDGGGLGAWPLEVVDVERLEGDTFALTVAGEPLRFVADDTVEFAYSGVPAIGKVSRQPRSRFGLRSFLDRIWNAPAESAPTPVRSQEASAVPDTPKSPDIPPEWLELAAMPEVFEEPVASETTVVGEWPVAPTAVPYLEPDVEEQPQPVDEISETQCPAIRSDGRRCESPILTASGYCYPHDPRRAFDDKYKAAQEAREQIRRDATGRLNRIYSRLDKAMRQVERGELDPELAMAMAQIARTMCAILDVEPSTAEDDRR